MSVVASTSSCYVVSSRGSLAAAACALLALASSSPADAARTGSPAERVALAEAPAKQPLLDPSVRMAIRAPLTAASAASTMPSLELRSQAVHLELDAYGSFGRSTAGGDALFDDGSRWASTVFEHMAHVRGIGFLDSQSLLQPPSGANPVREGDAVVATYQLGPWSVRLRSELVDCDQPHCGVLRQEWTLTNGWATPRELVFTSYLDGDLFFAGDYANDWAARSGETIYEFDDGSDPAAPSTFLGLSSSAPAALRSGREIGEYSDLRRRLLRGGYLSDRAVRADGTDADRDGNGVTDAGFDVTLGVQHDFGTLAPGQSVTVEVRVQWGTGAIEELGEAPVARAGDDQRLECAGAAGTPVVLDGSASTPAAALEGFAWTVDGEPAGDDAVVLLSLAPGVHAVELRVTDDQGRTATDTATVEVVDTQAPEVAVGTVASLWPPDHRLVPVSLPVSGSDACSGLVATRLLQVTSDEVSDTRRGGDGTTSVDVVLQDGTLYLRRERQGGGDGRVYRVLVEVADAAGNATLAEVVATVPDSPGRPAVDSGVAVTTILN